MLKRYMTTLLLGASLVFSGTQAFAATHQAKAGDTLWKLAKANHVSVVEMERANPALAPRNILIGQAIQIPAAGTYAVKDNDTFWSISQNLHVSVEALERANPFVNAWNVYPGIVLNVPYDSTSVKAAASTPKAAASKPNARPAASYKAQVLSVSRPSHELIQQPTHRQAQNVVTVAGNTMPVAKEISGIATAYTASAASNGSWGAVDYFGNPLRLGTIAVDPNVIPLGSKVYVTGYSFNGLPAGGRIFTASDIGGGIKGSHIDIFVPTTDGQASNFGIQNVKMYVLK